MISRSSIDHYKVRSRKRSFEEGTDSVRNLSMLLTLSLGFCYFVDLKIDRQHPGSAVEDAQAVPMLFLEGTLLTGK